MVDNLPILDLLLHGEVLIGPLLFVLVLGLVLRRPKLVEHSLVLGQASGVGVKCGLWSWNDPSINLDWSLLEQFTNLERLLNPESSLDLELLLFSHLLLEPEILMVPDGDL